MQNSQQTYIRLRSYLLCFCLLFGDITPIMIKKKNKKKTNKQKKTLSKLQPQDFPAFSRLLMNKICEIQESSLSRKFCRAMKCWVSGCKPSIFQGNRTLVLKLPLLNTTAPRDFPPGTLDPRTGAYIACSRACNCVWGWGWEQEGENENWLQNIKTTPN